MNEDATGVKTPDRLAGAAFVAVGASVAASGAGCAASGGFASVAWLTSVSGNCDDAAIVEVVSDWVSGAKRLPTWEDGFSFRVEITSNSIAPRQIDGMHEATASVRTPQTRLASM
jgi:hypothetical protein